VTSASLLALDLACRGGATSLFVMMAIVVLRDHRTTAACLGAALAVAGAAYAIGAAPGLPSGWWSPLLTLLASSGPVAFWLWARTTFDDDFVLKPRYAGLWITLVAARLLLDHGGTGGSRLSMTIDRGLAVVNFALALLAVAQTVATWRNDLVAGRRRLRVVVLIGTFAFIAGDAAANLSAVAAAGPGTASGNFGRALGLAALALAAGWSVLRTAASESGLSAPAAAFGSLVGKARADSTQHSAVEPAVDPALLHRIERLMGEERVYRREGLTIGALAAMLRLPEYRLRQVINEGLGHRNFNAFLNRHRIDETKAALADPGQKDVPVLTIAMDAGFQSIGPFNRAFKADTGMTPTEFRRLALAKGDPEA
jgi:AraC-like DNA-binding protein